MPCNLHDLIESINSNKILCIDPINDDEFDEITRIVKNVAPEAICFDMGDIDEIPPLSPVYEMVKEPFPTCWFECHFTHTDNTEIIIGLLVVSREEIQITSFRRKHKQWCIRGMIVLDSLSNWQNFGLFPPVDIVGEELKQHKLVLSTFLSALNCNNVLRVEHNPDPKLQKSRSKRGKLPLFSHWTLELAIPSQSNSNSETIGNNTSPRVHLRRGHPRQYSPGKWTWVQPCMVGANKGIITKDYSANYKNTEEPTS